MADPKKDKKESSGGDYQEEIVVMLVVLFLAWLFWGWLSQYRAEGGFGGIYGIWYSIRDFFVYSFWPILKILGAIICLAATVGIIHNHRKLSALNKEEKEIYGLVAVPLADGGMPQKKNEKWERVIEHINSPEPSDWRLAIIEADIMLDELLTAAGYHGDSVGEKLKAVESSDFTTIENAWEAHKTRNKIAHQGGDFPLNEREAKRAIALFESVFQEFKII